MTDVKVTDAETLEWVKNLSDSDKEELRRQALTAPGHNKHSELAMVTSTLAMKTALRILAWAAVAVAIMCWPTRPTSFNARWVAMPSAMSWDMLNRV